MDATAIGVILFGILGLSCVATLIGDIWDTRQAEREAKREAERFRNYWGKYKE